MVSRLRPKLVVLAVTLVSAKIIGSIEKIVEIGQDQLIRIWPRSHFPLHLLRSSASREVREGGNHFVTDLVAIKKSRGYEAGGWVPRFVGRTIGSRLPVRINREQLLYRNQGFQRGVVLYNWAILRPVQVRFWVRSYDREEERVPVSAPTLAQP
ncbi:uncharacterized protein BDR25DRAFT_351048 [Lindgomyces ingoldianus]|uniref:Uncharacterized protein n=1 Tax=Lindgomyces ingoldianus TaxID=673940 RepID=A0ACB6R5E6_9PLEO|nr:uncharacterized protein BDR25DRAFT_351048 [Lindgomyces ingoldianus]KAF2474529.1 hypothetical protein BDR25DRAFT_351048 [Lindgomyces ingoldianus]